MCRFLATIAQIFFCSATVVQLRGTSAGWLAFRDAGVHKTCGWALTRAIGAPHISKAPGVGWLLWMPRVVATPISRHANGPSGVGSSFFGPKSYDKRAIQLVLLEFLLSTEEKTGSRLWANRTAEKISRRRGVSWQMEIIGWSRGASVFFFSLLFSLEQGSIFIVKPPPRQCR